MSIPAYVREHDVAVQRRWYEMTGVDQARLSAKDTADQRWRRLGQAR